MLNTQLKGMPYHGWQIKVVQERGIYCFQCYPPELTNFCSDGSTYIHFKEAFVAACHFVDREIAIQALLDIIESWLQDGRITTDEYWNLTGFD